MNFLNLLLWLCLFLTWDPIWLNGMGNRPWARGVHHAPSPPPCLSVRLSICGQNSVRSVSSRILLGSISYLHILLGNFRRCVACNAHFKIEKFENLVNFLNLLLWLCLFLTWDPIWLNGMGNRPWARGVHHAPSPPNPPTSLQIYSSYLKEPYKTRIPNYRVGKILLWQLWPFNSAAYVLND